MGRPSDCPVYGSCDYTKRKHQIAPRIGRQLQWSHRSEGIERERSWRIDLNGGRQAGRIRVSSLRFRYFTNVAFRACNPMQIVALVKILGGLAWSTNPFSAWSTAGKGGGSGTMVTTGRSAAAHSEVFSVGEKCDGCEIWTHPAHCA